MRIISAEKRSIFSNFVIFQRFYPKLVRETWFFGLALLESNGDYVWLKSDKELRHELKAHLNKDDPDQMVSVYFLVKVV